MNFTENPDAVKELIKGIETPFFLFSKNIIEKNYNNLCSAFTKNYEKVRIDYSVKTNNELSVLKILKNLGSSAEIAAIQEFRLARRAGFKPNQLTFDSPYKSLKDINYCIDKKIHLINIDSINEFQKITNNNKECNIGFRVNLGFKNILPAVAENCINKFGFKPKQVINCCKKLTNKKNINPISIHSHLGSQISSPKIYLKAIEKLIDITKELQKQDIDIKEINIGGGFPSTTLKKMQIHNLLLSKLKINYNKKPYSIEEFGNQISQKFAQKISELNTEPTLVLQPGRSIVSTAGIMASKIKTIKDKWIFLDASTGSIPESIFFAKRNFLFVDKLNEKHNHTYNISGSSLNSADIFAFNTKMPKPEINNNVFILDAGAYSISRANRFTILNPPVYLLEKNKLKLIRRKETYNDLVSPML